MKRPAPAPGHETASPDACPECNRAPGWQDKTGLRYFVQVIRHESDTDEDLTLADVIEYVATQHLCGEQWHTEDEFPNIAGIRCQAWIDMRFARNEYIMKRLAEIRERWSM